MGAFFPKATPEQVGISSQHVIDFLDELERADVCMHSVLLIRHGKLAAEAYYAPYTADTPHRMFSVTKSFTSLAIGLLAAEGRLSLDDRIVDHFPEKLPEAGAHPYINQITIRDMLKMATAHASTTYKRTSDPDWVKSFLQWNRRICRGLFSIMTHQPATLWQAWWRNLPECRCSIICAVNFWMKSGFPKQPTSSPIPWVFPWAVQDSWRSRWMWPRLPGL